MRASSTEGTDTTEAVGEAGFGVPPPGDAACVAPTTGIPGFCLLYTSDAADERSSVDLGGRRLINKKTKKKKNVMRRDNDK